MKKIEQLEAAFAAATPGKWDWHLGTQIEQDDLATVEVHPVHDPEDTVVMLEGVGSQAANVEFIALAHNAMPALLDAVRLAKRIIAQDPITCGDDAPLPYRQLAALVNAYQAEARKLLEALQ